LSSASAERKPKPIGFETKPWSIQASEKTDQEQRPTTWSANCCKAASDTAIADGSNSLPLYNSQLEKTQYLLTALTS